MENILKHMTWLKLSSLLSRMLIPLAGAAKIHILFTFCIILWGDRTFADHVLKIPW